MCTTRMSATLHLPLPCAVRTTPLLSYGVVAKLWIYRVCRMICSVLCHQHHFITLYIDRTVLSLLVSWKEKCANVVIKELLFPKKCIRIRLGHKTTIGHTPSVKYLHVLGKSTWAQKIWGAAAKCLKSTRKNFVRMWVSNCRTGTEVWSENLLLRKAQVLLLIFNPQGQSVAYVTFVGAFFLLPFV